jgi:hypothetical protein
MRHASRFSPKLKDLKFGQRYRSPAKWTSLNTVAREGSEMQRLRDHKLGPFHAELNRTRMHNGVCHAGFDRPAEYESLFLISFAT